jgi:hypothetical protein
LQSGARSGSGVHRLDRTDSVRIRRRVLALADRQHHHGIPPSRAPVALSD